MGNKCARPVQELRHGWGAKTTPNFNPLATLVSRVADFGEIPKYPTVRHNAAS
jgi:hypothetical protein